MKHTIERRVFSPTHPSAAAGLPFLICTTCEQSWDVDSPRDLEEECAGDWDLRRLDPIEFIAAIVREAEQRDAGAFGAWLAANWTTLYIPDPWPERIAAFKRARAKGHAQERERERELSDALERAVMVYAPRTSAEGENAIGLLAGFAVILARSMGMGEDTIKQMLNDVLELAPENPRELREEQLTKN